MLDQELLRRDFLKRFAKSMAVLTSASTAGALISACSSSEGENAAQENTASENTDTSVSPEYFSPHLMQSLNILCEKIIPKTDTPGALEAGIPAYIESVIRDVFKREEQQRFNDGFFSLDLMCNKIYQKNYVDLPPHKHEKIARHLNLVISKSDDDIKQVLLKKSTLSERELDSALHYFSLVKELTIFGFFTSEIGASQVLQYIPIPGRFEGCIDISEAGRAWATPR